MTNESDGMRAYSALTRDTAVLVNVEWMSDSSEPLRRAGRVAPAMVFRRN